MTAVWGTASETPIPKGGPWDCLYVAGILMPGLLRMNGHGLKHDLQVKKAAGYNGATVTDLGRELVRFSATLILSCQQDWDEFVRVVPKLQPTRPNKGTGKMELEPVTVAHPSLEPSNVTSAKVERIGIPHPGHVVGTYEVDIEFLEHRVPTKMRASGTGHKDVKLLDANASAKPVDRASETQKEKKKLAPKVNTDP